MCLLDVLVLEVCRAMGMYGSCTLRILCEGVQKQAVTNCVSGCNCVCHMCGVSVHRKVCACMLAFYVKVCNSKS